MSEPKPLVTYRFRVWPDDEDGAEEWAETIPVRARETIYSDRLIRYAVETYARDQDLDQESPYKFAAVQIDEAGAPIGVPQSFEVTAEYTYSICHKGDRKP